MTKVNSLQSPRLHAAQGVSACGASLTFVRPPDDPSRPGSSGKGPYGGSPQAPYPNVSAQKFSVEVQGEDIVVTLPGISYRLVNGARQMKSLAAA
jgi:hypothetical protein